MPILVKNLGYRYMDPRRIRSLQYYWRAQAAAGKVVIGQEVVNRDIVVAM